MRRDIMSRIISFALTLAIVTGIVWMMSKSMKPPMETNTSATTQTTLPSTARQEQNETTLDVAHSEDMLRLLTAAQAQADEPRQQLDQIYKCGSAQKPTYSDEKCLSIENAKTVEIHETSGGFTSPDQQTIAETRARIRAEIQQPGTVAVTGKTVSGMTTNTQGECYYLANEIDAIDATSRIGQTGKSQEQLRLRREDVRTRQYRLGC